MLVGDVGPPLISAITPRALGPGRGGTTWQVQRRGRFCGFCWRENGAFSAVLIALSILGLGAGGTAAVGERVFDALSGGRGPDSPPWPPTMDNEPRFYATL